jgi:uncharacterized protein (DUF927 family)
MSAWVLIEEEGRREGGREGGKEGNNYTIKNIFQVSGQRSCIKYYTA